MFVNSAFFFLQKAYFERITVNDVLTIFIGVSRGSENGGFTVYLIKKHSIIEKKIIHCRAKIYLSLRPSYVLHKILNHLLFD